MKADRNKAESKNNNDTWMTDIEREGGEREHERKKKKEDGIIKCDKNKYERRYANEMDVVGESHVDIRESVYYGDLELFDVLDEHDKCIMNNLEANEGMTNNDVYELHRNLEKGREILDYRNLEIFEAPEFSDLDISNTITDMNDRDRGMGGTEATRGGAKGGSEIPDYGNFEHFEAPEASDLDINNTIMNMNNGDRGAGGTGVTRGGGTGGSEGGDEERGENQGVDRTDTEEQNRETRNNGEDHSIETNSENSDQNIDSDSENSTTSDDNPRWIKCIAWNIEGLFEKINIQDICNFLKKFDIICLSETFTFDNFDFNIKFNEYIHLHCPAIKFSRLGRPSGGLVTMIRKEFKEFIEKIETNIKNVLCFKINKSLTKTEKDIIFIGTYVHPVNSIFYTDKDYDSTIDMIEELITDQIESDQDNLYLIGGDLNARISDWGYNDEEEEDQDNNTDNYNRTSQDTVTNNFGKKLIELCTTFKLTPVGGLTSKHFDNKYTYISKRGNSTIDHYICSTELLDNIKKYQTEDRIESPHQPITINLESNREQGRQLKKRKQKITKIIWQEDKIDKCTDILNSEEIIETINQLTEDLTEIEPSLANFYDTIDNIIKPMKKTLYLGGKKKKPIQEWYDKDCTENKKKTMRALKRLNRIDKNTQPNKYQEKRNKYVTARTEYQKLIRDKKKEHRKQMYEKLVASTKDSREFWNTIRKTRVRHNKIADISPTQWEQHFTQLLNPDGIENTQENNNPTEHQRQAAEQINEQNVCIEDLDKEISKEELGLAFQKLKKRKAPGIDEIPPEVLKLIEPKISTYLLKLFNKIYELGQFPHKWTQAIIVPLFKKGDTNQPGNYRGISLLCIISKLFTAILNKRLYNWAEQNEKISEEQAGFRKNYSTIDHIYTLHSMIDNCLYGRKRSKIYIAFIDFQKAFDTVKREVLWEILKKLNISTKMIKMIKEIYKSVTAIVRYDNEITNPFNCPLGVKQGCLLSPLLFSLFINEVAAKVGSGGRAGYQFLPGTKEIFALLFADDIALIAMTPAGLQNQLNNLNTASKALGLKVNLNKTKILVCRKGGFLGSREKWFLDQERIEVVNSYKYLGYTITTKLSTDISLAEYAGRAKGKIIDIFKTLYRLGHIDTNIFFKLFDTQVKPMLLYAAELWGMTKYETIEKIHTFACKKLLGVSARTPNALALGEIGRYPLYIDSSTRTLKYWFKITLLQENRLPKIAYNRGKTERNNQKGWAQTLKNSLETNGFGNIWLNEGTENINRFIKIFKQRLIDQYKQTWHDKMTNSERYNIYKTIKEDHKKEEYLNYITIAKYRKTFTRLRLGIIELNYNKRFNDPNADKDCPFCREVETEEHFLLDCTSYNQLRFKYISRHWITLNNVNVNDLIANKNSEITKSTAQYAYHALRKREEMI